MTDLFQVSATELARRIREGEASSSEVVEAHVAQIERVNGALNAVVVDRFDEARREAERADAVRERSRPDDLPPFHGVPCTIKECFALTGMPNTAGLLARRGLLADGDATAVARLRAAGAIPLGVTNTSELCMWMESDNHVYGRTNNPYDLERIVGGSSGGEAAIIAAGASPLGLGSDVGGSIRGPCFFNGIFGHKPTGGLIPNTGQFPIAHGAGLRYLTTGPMVRRAEDLMPLVRILAGPDGHDDGCRELALGDPASVVLEGRRVVDVPDNGHLEVSDDLRGAQARLVQALVDRGMRTERREFPKLRHQADVWSAMMAEAQAEPFGTMLGEGRPIRPVRELLRHLFGRSPHTPMASILALVDPVPKLFPGQTQKLVSIGARLRAELLEAMGDEGVLVYPTYTTPAPRHGVPVREALRLKLPFAHQGIFNVLELPATQVPLGLNAEGLPVGAQIVSAPGNDHVTIACAVAIEEALGGWQPPSLAGLA